MTKPLLTTALLAFAFYQYGTRPAELSSTLSGHAQLPGSTFVAAPSGAAEHYNVSGRFTGQEGRIEQLYTNMQATGLALPFPSQPLQVFWYSLTWR